ncbi:MAG TPA: hypothetical protein VME68_11045 [Acidobacteriaceae bacterium]|nr:hypothetical protein [Acidobacteriaceae bacterium]
MAKTVWRCEQVRGNEVTSRVVFDSEEKATSFITRMRIAEPDVNVTWRVERVEAEEERG